MANYTKIVAQQLNLAEPNSYTSHCLRRSSATIMVDHDFTELQLMGAGRWMGAQSCRKYQGVSEKAKLHIANAFNIVEQPADPIINNSEDISTTRYHGNSNVTNIFTFDMKYSKNCTINLQLPSDDDVQSLKRKKVDYFDYESS